MFKFSLIALLAVAAVPGLMDTEAEASHRRRGRNHVVVPYGSVYGYGYPMSHSHHYHVQPAPVVVPHSHNCAPPVYYPAPYPVHRHRYRSSSGFYLRTPSFSFGVRR